MCHYSPLYANNTIAFLCYSTVYTLCINNYNYQTIIQQTFVTEIFKLLRLLSSNAPCLYTRLTEHHSLSRMIWLAFYMAGLMNVLEGECFWFCLLEISINLNIVVYIHYCCMCILFTFILVVLLVYSCLPFFYAGVCCYIKQYRK